MTSVTSAGNGSPLVHIGRQAIYNRLGDVVGYELLFRGTPEANHASRRAADATSQVILGAFAEFGMEELVGDRWCFLNMTREFLVGHLPLPFPPHQVVLEVLETVEIDDEVISGIATLVDKGFRIALDDFVWGQGHERLLDLAAYVKIDMLETDRATLLSTVAAVRRRPGVQLVAERIESPDGHQVASLDGFDLFQGYVFGQPQTLSAVTLNPSRLRRLELFTALTAPDVPMEEVVRIVTADPGLSYRVLRATNAAAAGVPRRVASVHDAVMLLGADRIRQWVALMLVSDMSEASAEQLSAMMSRARLCQTVAERLDVPADSAFTVGLLAGVLELLAGSEPDLVERLPVTTEIRDALVDGAGRLGRVLGVVRAYEHSDASVLAHGPVSSADLARAYLAAIGWSQRTLDGLSADSAARRG